jgi:hypothetical protein
MQGIKELHLEDMDVVVEPGVGWIELNKYLKPHGLFFPLDPGPDFFGCLDIVMSCLMSGLENKIETDVEDHVIHEPSDFSKPARDSYVVFLPSFACPARMLFSQLFFHNCGWMQVLVQPSGACVLPGVLVRWLCGVSP